MPQRGLRVLRRPRGEGADLPASDRPGEDHGNEGRDRNYDYGEADLLRSSINELRVLWLVVDRADFVTHPSDPSEIVTPREEQPSGLGPLNLATIIGVPTWRESHTTLSMPSRLLH